MSGLSINRRYALLILVVIFGIAICTAIVVASVYHGPEQPIPFSHRIHVQTKKLNCFFCHNTAAVSSNASIPPVEKCLLCHNVIASNFPPIAKILDYDRKKQPIPWQRVYRLPEFVRFSHQPHIARRIDCSVCHGNVQAMDRIAMPNHGIRMGFCVECHWKHKVTSDCSRCHY